MPPLDRSPVHLPRFGPSPLRDRTAIIVVGALLALLAASRLLLLGRPISFLDDRSLVDDTYIYLTIARNIATGLGPWFETNHTNGFQPLYAFLLVPFFRLWPDDPLMPLRAALVLLTLCEVLALFFTIRLALRLGAGLPAVAIAAVAWIFNPYCLRMTLSGMETMLACCLSAYCWDIYYRDVHLARGLLTPLRAAILGAAVGLAILARIDALLLAPIIFCAALWRWRTLGIPIRRQFSRVAAVALALSAVCIPWLVYSIAYTGLIFPISGPASRLQVLITTSGGPEWILGQFRVAIGRFLAINQIALALLCAAALAAILFLRGRGLTLLRRQVVLIGPLLLWATTLIVAYAGFIHTYWYFERYFLPTLVAGTIASALAAGVCSGRIAPRLRLPLAALLVLAVSAYGCQSHKWRTFYGKDKALAHSGYMSAANWVAHRFEPGTVIGSTQAGAFSYFAPQLTVVNLDGVVNHAAYIAVRDSRVIPYMREMNVRYAVEWPSGMNLISQRSTTGRERMKLVDQIPVVTWGLPWLIYELLPTEEAIVLSPRADARLDNPAEIPAVRRLTSNN